jgi:hypothetical protein
MKKKPYEIYWDQEREIGRLKAFGESNIKSDKRYISECIKVSQSHGRKTNWLVDLLQAEGTEPNSKRHWTEWARNSSTGLIAIVGAKGKVKDISDEVIEKANKQNTVAFFHSKESALQWLALNKNFYR